VRWPASADDPANDVIESSAIRATETARAEAGEPAMTSLLRGGERREGARRYLMLTDGAVTNLTTEGDLWLPRAE
jgi:hypothetical protein